MTDSELDRCMRRFYTSVYSVALCYCKNPSDADDIAQDVFLALYTHSGNFNDDEHIKAWLLRCAVNRSINLLRSYRRRATVPLEAAENKAYTDTGGDDGRELLRQIMKLKRKNGVVLYLHYFEEYTVGEIAKMLGISEAAVRSRLLRGREQLKKLLESERN